MITDQPLTVVIDGRTIPLGLASSEPLVRAVMISLFTWRRANPDDALPDGKSRMGWWGDSFPTVANDRIVQADSARLHQVVWNLVKNAVKFTPAGGSIVIMTTNTPDGWPHRCIAIGVTDSGIGIDRELLPKIFDAFEQGDPNITRTFGGLGLGLAISKSLIEVHGGSILASSE